MGQQQGRGRPVKTERLDTDPVETGNSETAVACPICGAAATFFSRHPDARLYRCGGCTHCFSHLQTVELERYQENYFYEDHKRWFENPNIGLFERIAKTIPR